MKDKQKCNDRDCPVHAGLKTRGRIFEGKVVKKFERRIVLEFDRMVYNKKYERYAKRRTKIHSRLPRCFEGEIAVGDFVQVRECRPLSKIIHTVLIKRIDNKK